MADLTLVDHPVVCTCPGCTGTIDQPEAFSLDPFAGQTYAGKPI